MENYNEIRMIRRRYRTLTLFILILLFLGALATLLLLNLFDSPSSSVISLPFEVIASDLDSPRGIAFGPDGALYIAEAGRGGDGPCIPGSESMLCFGLSGAVTRVLNGHQQRIVTGLPSLISPDGSEGAGPHDVFVRGDDVFVLVGLGANPALRDGSIFPDSAGTLGTIIRLLDGDGWETIADISAHEASANPDGGDIDSNPFALVALENGFIVVDAGANDVIGVDASNNVYTLAVFPDGLADAPPFMDLAPGAQVPMQAVPTSIAVGPDGDYYIGQLTGFPFPVGAANIFRMAQGEEPVVFADGFTNIIDLAFDDDGNLWVLEIAGNSLLSDEPAGALIRVSPNGERETVISEGLTMPTGIAIGPDNRIYISNCGVCMGLGEVVRISDVVQETSGEANTTALQLTWTGLIASAAMTSAGGLVLIAVKRVGAAT